MAPPMTIEERQARITQIRARQTELDTEFRGMTFTDDARTEFEQLAEERAEHESRDRGAPPAAGLPRRAGLRGAQPRDPGRALPDPPQRRRPRR
jgi:hypothetical protein